MSMFDNCPICHRTLESEKIHQVTTMAEVVCAYCGTYKISMGFGRGSVLPTYNSVVISAIIQEANEYGSKIPEIMNEEDLKSYIAATYVPRNVYEKANKILKYLSMNSKPGHLFYFTQPTILPKLQALSFSETELEVKYYLDFLKDSGYIDIEYFDNEQMRTPNFLIITMEGWRKIEELGQTSIGSKQAFVAMSYDSPMKTIWENGIRKAVEDAGYAPYRIDEKEHNEKICDLILIEVRKSRFVVADITMHKKGVYFEAGYAQGLGIPVIWCCKDDPTELKNMHFDTRQYNHILWKDEKDLNLKLFNRIKATII